MISHTQFQKRWLLAFILAPLSACVQQPHLSVGSDSCEQVLSHWQATRHRSDKTDAQVHVVGDAGVFAINRFMANQANSLDTPAAKEFWLRESWRLAQAQRQIEFANLRAALSLEQQEKIEGCAGQALHQQLNLVAKGLSPSIFSAKVPDDYRLWPRIFGLYPLTRLFVISPAKADQSRSRALFQQVTPPSSTRRYLPMASEPVLDPDEISALLLGARTRNPLGMPVLEDESLREIIMHYAPGWQIDSHTSSDRPGMVTWQTPTKIRIDHQQPAMYTLPSYANFQGETLLQLNYFIWFSERPKTGKLDLYGGQLDGLIWRVTLRSDGSVLAYDSIHQCGCFHQFFPVDPRLRPRPDVPFQEPVLALDAAIPDGLRERVVVQLTHSDHSIVGVQGQPFLSNNSESLPVQTEEKSKEISTLLRLVDYNKLRSLPIDDGHQSLFASDGLIPLSRRLERWLLWPMGIKSAGAMRQWGHHATAFVGRRHFDEPHLIERLFFYGPQPLNRASNEGSLSGSNDSN